MLVLGERSATGGPDEVEMLRNAPTEPFRNHVIHRLGALAAPKHEQDASAVYREAPGRPGGRTVRAGRWRGLYGVPGIDHARACGRGQVIARLREADVDLAREAAERPNGE